MNDTFERLRVLVMKDYKLQPDQVTLDAPLASLGVDSLGAVELLWNVEAEFHVRIPPDAVELATLGDVVRYVDELVARQTVRPAPAPAGKPGLRAP